MLTVHSKREILEHDLRALQGQVSALAGKLHGLAVDLDFERLWPDQELGRFRFSVHGPVVQFGVVRAARLVAIPQGRGPVVPLARGQVYDVLLNGKIIESNRDVGGVGIVADADEAADRDPAVAASALDVGQLDPGRCDSKESLDRVQRESARPQQAEVAHNTQQLVRRLRRAL